jgi:hypothetical protein
MKKIMTAALALVTVLAFTVPAMAGAILDKPDTVTFAGDTTYDLSNSVYMDYVAADSYTDAQYYSIGTVHSGGNRMFVTTSETSVIWWQTVIKGTTTSPNVTPSWTTGQFPTAWDSL